MKIPESVRIGGVEYRVREDCPALNDGENLLYGRINYRANEIELSEIVKGHQKKCIVLWHEILHGIREHAGLEIADEEKVVEMFARGIYQVLQDNGGRLFDLKEVNGTGAEAGPYADGGADNG